jgi:hypothetical protein
MLAHSRRAKVAELHRGLAHKRSTLTSILDRLAFVKSQVYRKCRHGGMRSVDGWLRTHLIANRRYILAADVADFNRMFALDEFAGKVSSLSSARSTSSNETK